MKTDDTHGSLCALLQPVAFDSGEGFSHAGWDHGEEMPAAAGRDLYDVRVCISHVDRAIIRSYLRDHHCYLLATGHATPQLSWPELEPRWIRYRALPFDLWVESDLLPDELERKLSTLPTGFERVLLGPDVLLVHAPTRRIADVMCHAHESLS